MFLFSYITKKAAILAGVCRLFSMLYLKIYIYLLPDKRFDATTLQVTIDRNCRRTRLIRYKKKILITCKSYLPVDPVFWENSPGQRPQRIVSQSLHRNLFAVSATVAL